MCIAWHCHKMLHRINGYSWNLAKWAFLRLLMKECAPCFIFFKHSGIYISVLNKFNFRSCPVQIYKKICQNLDGHLQLWICKYSINLTKYINFVQYFLEFLMLFKNLHLDIYCMIIHLSEYINLNSLIIDLPSKYIWKCSINFFNNMRTNVKMTELIVACYTCYKMLRLAYRLMGLIYSLKSFVSVNV